jgi:hypothetical protein
MVARRADLETAFRHALGGRDTDLALDLAAGFAALDHRVGTVALGVARLDEALALEGGDRRRRKEALWCHVALLLCELRVGAARTALARLRELVDGEADEERLRTF